MITYIEYINYAMDKNNGKGIPPEKKGIKHVHYKEMLIFVEILVSTISRFIYT